MNINEFTNLMVYINYYNDDNYIVKIFNLNTKKLISSTLQLSKIKIEKYKILDNENIGLLIGNSKILFEIETNENLEKKYYYSIITPRRRGQIQLSEIEILTTLVINKNIKIPNEHLLKGRILKVYKF